MSRPHIACTISLGPWPSQDDVTFVIPLSEFAVREASEKLDFPTADAPVAIKAFICTPPDVIANVLRQRREFAKLIGAAVAAKALEAFEARDELMGYPKRGVHETKAPLMACDQVCERHGNKGCTHPFCTGMD